MTQAIWLVCWIPVHCIKNLKVVVVSTDVSFSYPPQVKCPVPRLVFIYTLWIGSCLETIKYGTQLLKTFKKDALVMWHNSYNNEQGADPCDKVPHKLKLTRCIHYFNSFNLARWDTCILNMSASTSKVL